MSRVFLKDFYYDHGGKTPKDTYDGIGDSSL